MRILIFGFFLLSLGACATVGPQTRNLVNTPLTTPREHTINEIALINQTDNDCGPATLTMAMHHAGSPVAFNEIFSEVYVSEKKGSLPMDLVRSAREHELLAVNINDLTSIVKEVAAGHPVIALENLGFGWLPKWHYSLIVGYDLNQQEFIKHSGAEAFQRQPINYFERNWNLGGNWAIVILPPNELAISASELQHLKAANGLEQARKEKAAQTAYEKINSEWPNSLAARIGLANILYKQKNILATIKILEEALKLHPNSLAAQHNLKVAKNSLKELNR